MAVNARFPGGCHDSGIWAASEVRSYLASIWTEDNPVQLISDRGYPCEPWCFPPIPNPTEDYEREYNKVQVPTRMLIEQAFGVLKSTFRCISSGRKLHYLPQRAIVIINSCFILYNYMKMNNYPMLEPTPEQRNAEVEVQDVSYVVVPEEARRIRDTYARRFV